MRNTGLLPLILSVAVCPLGTGRATEQSSMNPIARIARIFDSELVRTEERVLWLEAKRNTLAMPNEHSLRTDLGYRGMRTHRATTPLGVVLDLGRDLPLSALFLVPAQGEFFGDPGIFPRAITIECSSAPDFSRPTLVHKTREKSESVDGLYPLEFPVKTTARYVRLLVDEGVVRENMEIFGLSEILVAAEDGVPVSFGARVLPLGGLQDNSVWNPRSLVDGRTPLGIWQTGNRNSPTKGDAAFPEDSAQEVAWRIDLESSAPVSHIVLFPYEINRSFGTFVLPESIHIQLMDGDQTSATLEWNNPTPGGSHQTPLILAAGEARASRITIRTSKSWMMGDQRICALSEVEVWSELRNRAFGLHVTRTHRNREETTGELTDGYSSIQKILPCGAWLSQLRERSEVDRELLRLRPIYRNLEAHSELNAAWGGSVVLGLTFLVPVFVFERRRLTSREQINQLRRRIASDLHDDIGSNLGSISLIARTARKDLERIHGPEGLARDLVEMENIARESSLAMRDIVWLLERRQDSIGDLFQRMRETSNRLLRELEVELDCQTTRTTARLSLDAKRHLFLFFKEAVHNILKHSKASKVRIHIGDQNDLFIMEITDNGVGIPQREGTSQSSLAKLDDRARVLGAQLRIRSAAGSGTTIRLEVKRTLLAKQGE